MKMLLPLTKYSLGALTLFIASQTHADTVFGIYAGAGAWQSEYSGNTGNPSADLNELGFAEKNNSFYYIAIEHPVPFFPNIKLQKNDISSRQTGTTNKEFGNGNTYYPADSDITTDFDLSYIDAALYYEILDNWLNLDLGITLRKYTGQLYAENTEVNNEVEVDVTLPLAYARFQFDLPLTGFSAGAEGNFISYSGNSVTDYSAKISYLFDSAMDLGIEAGYKSASIKIDEDDANTDIQLKGPYIAAIFHF